MSTPDFNVAHSRQIYTVIQRSDPHKIDSWSAVLGLLDRDNEKTVSDIAKFSIGSAMASRINTKPVPVVVDDSATVSLNGAVSSGEQSANASDWDMLLDAIAHRPKRATERKQDRSKRTEQQILNAALRVFSRDGISRSRIADIAAEAGISTSTLYEYYKSKEDLAYDVPLNHLASFFDEYRLAVQGKESARERLVLYLSMSADFAREHAEWGRLFYLEIWPSVFVSETELRHNVDDFARVVLFLVNQGMVEGDFSPRRNAYETTALLMGGVNQIIITWLLYRRPKNLSKAGIEITERVLAMLKAECDSDAKSGKSTKRR
jgi:AcrR family transcriptional regulator